MTAPERSHEAVAERLREIASDIFSDNAGTDEIRMLHNLADQFDERAQAAKNDDGMRDALRKAAEKAGREVFFSEEAKPGMTYTDTPFGPMGVNMERYYDLDDDPVSGQLSSIERARLALEQSQIVKGGQGRTAASVTDDAVGMFTIVAWVVIGVLLALAAVVFWVVL